MNRIKELRESKGMTQIRLSIELSLSQETVSAYENGKHYPSVENLIKMSKIFNASCDYILGLSDTKAIISTGKYTKDEILLISKYRAVRPTSRNLISAYVQGIYDKENKIKYNYILIKHRRFFHPKYVSF